MTGKGVVLVTDDVDYRKFMNLENYLFKEVHNKFHQYHKLDAFDYFCIIIWKANRSKSKHAEKLKNLAKKNKIGSKDLEEICNKITKNIHTITTKEEKLRYLLDKWEMRLPTSSAILTVLYPTKFTIYDYRVCEILEDHKYLDRRKTESLIGGYFKEFIPAVKEKCKKYRRLRDKDRYLWGMSFAKQLEKDIDRGFK